MEGNPLKLEDEFRHPRHTAMLAAAKASLIPSPRAELKIEATPREEKLPVTHRQGLACHVAGGVFLKGKDDSRICQFCQVERNCEKRMENCNSINRIPKKKIRQGPFGNMENV